MTLRHNSGGCAPGTAWRPPTMKVGTEVMPILRLSRATAFALTLASLLFGARAEAHDLWLLPPEQPAKIGEPVQVRATQGMDFPGSGVAPKVERLAAAYVLAPNGQRIEMKRREPRGFAGILEFVPTTPGMHTVVVDTTPKTIELDALDFNHYLVADGMPHVYVQRHEEKTLDRNAVERYVKTVKLLLMVGDGPTTVARTKQRLEIVPEQDVTKLRPHTTLAVRVYFRGRPLAGARVGLDRPKDGDEPSAVVRADADGRALFPIAGSGLTTLRLTHMERPQTKDYEWSSTWTTMTFVVPE